jgi:large subunit ribosomal protein L25
MEISLECQKRPEGSKPKALRRQGAIPAVLYGHKGTESVSLTLNEKDASVLLRQASVNNTLIDLKVPDMPWNGKVLIREVQAHPWKRTLYHLSFFSVAANETVEVSAPVNIVGEAPGVKIGGGILDHVLTELKVECIPGDIPESIDVDVSEMEIGTTLQVKDLILPKGVTVLDDSENTVLSIQPPIVATAETSEESAEEAEEESSEEA